MRRLLILLLISFLGLGSALAQKDSLILHGWGEVGLVYGSPDWFHVPFFAPTLGFGVNIPWRLREGWQWSAGLFFVPPLGYKSADGPAFKIVDGAKYLELKPGLSYRGIKRLGFDASLAFGYMLNKRAIEKEPDYRVRRMWTGLSLGLSYQKSPAWSVRLGYDYSVNGMSYSSYYYRGEYKGIDIQHANWAYLGFRYHLPKSGLLRLPDRKRAQLAPAGKRRALWIEGAGILGLFQYSELKYGLNNPFTWTPSWSVGVGMDRRRVKRPKSFVSTSLHYTALLGGGKETTLVYPMDVVQLKWGIGRDAGPFSVGLLGSFGYLFDYLEREEWEIVGFLPENITEYWLGGQLNASFRISGAIRLVGTYDFILNNVYTSKIYYNTSGGGRRLLARLVYTPEWFSLGVRIRLAGH